MCQYLTVDMSTYWPVHSIHTAFKLTVSEAGNHIYRTHSRLSLVQARALLCSYLVNFTTGATPHL